MNLKDKTIEIIQTEQQRANRLKKKKMEKASMVFETIKKKKSPHCCHWGCKRWEKSG